MIDSENTNKTKRLEEKANFMTRTPVVWGGALICCLLWGSAFPCIKIGYSLMNIASEDTASQILYAGCRFFLAGVLAILLGSIGNRKFLVPRRDEFVKVMFLSLFQTILQYLFFYIGLAHTSGVKASIVEGMNVFVAVLVAGFVFRMEKINSQKMLGCFVGFAGVVLINVMGSSSGALSMEFAWNGEGFIFLSTVAYAFSSVILKRYSKEHNPVMLSGYQFLFGGLVMILCGLLMGGSLQLGGAGAATSASASLSAAGASSALAAALGMLLYLAFVSAVAYTLWGILLKYNPVSRVAVFGFMNPVFGVILSALLLQEGSLLGWSSILALILVSVGIYIVNRGPATQNENM